MGVVRAHVGALTGGCGQDMWELKGGCDQDIQGLTGGCGQDIHVCRSVSSITHLCCHG